MIPSRFRRAALVLGAAACRYAPPDPPADRRAALLDSLAGRSACAALPFRVAADTAQWRPAHACGVAAGALAVLGAAPARESYWGPGDAGRVRAAGVSQQQWCVLGTRPAHMDTVRYVVGLAVPERPYLLVVSVNALSLRGTVAASTEDSSDPAALWTPPGTRHLVAPGTPCG